MDGEAEPPRRGRGAPKRGGTDARLSFLTSEHFLAELARAADYWGMDRQSYLRGALDHDVCRALEARDGGEASVPVVRRRVDSDELLRFHAVEPVPLDRKGEPRTSITQESNTKVPKEFKALVAEAAAHRGLVPSAYIRHVVRDAIRFTEARRATGHPPEQLSESRIAEGYGIHLAPELVRDSLTSIGRFVPGSR